MATPTRSIRKVLLVDDDPHLIDGLTRALFKEPYELLTASCAAEALEILRNTEIAVVISDEMMPGMRGTELLALARREFPGTVRILLTGNANLEIALHAINVGEVYRLVTKPCHGRVLALTIRRALAVEELKRESARLLDAARWQQRQLEASDRDDSIELNVEDDGTIQVSVDISDIVDQIRSTVDVIEKGRLRTRSK